MHRQAGTRLTAPTALASNGPHPCPSPYPHPCSCSSPRSPAGPTRSLISWARLPLPLLLEGSQFCYPLRQCPLPAPALQLALSMRANDGWDSTLWHSNLPILAARSGAMPCPRHVALMPGAIGPCPPGRAPRVPAELAARCARLPGRVHLMLPALLRLPVH